MKIGDTKTCQIATGGDPVGALVKAARLYNPKRKPWGLYTAVRHDDGCPCLMGWPMTQCTCEIVQLEIERVA